MQKLGLAQERFLAVTLKAFANSSPGQRPGVSMKIPLWRTLKVFARAHEPFQGSWLIIQNLVLPRALPWAGTGERFQRLVTHDSSNYCGQGI